MTAHAILAFDTAAAHCAAAVLRGDRIMAQAEEPMAKGQAERLMGLCAALLEETNLTFQDLCAIGVGIGPGNFTGVRISVAAARGLALGLSVPAVGISRFEALRLGQTGPCTCAVEAPRGHIYLQRYDGQTAYDPALVSADAIPPHDRPLIGAQGEPPVFPHAEAIARLASDRYTDTTTRPAPLYLRPADAAPARDMPPVILP